MYCKCQDQSKSADSVSAGIAQAAATVRAAALRVNHCFVSRATADSDFSSLTAMCYFASQDEKRTCMQTVTLKMAFGSLLIQNSVYQNISFLILQ